MTLKALLIIDGLRDSNLAHDMFVMSKVTYDQAKTLRQAQGLIRNRDYDIIVTATRAREGLIGPKSVQYLKDKGKNAVIVALGGADDEEAWSDINPDYFRQKYHPGVFFTGYQFRDILNEKFPDR